MIRDAFEYRTTTESRRRQGECEYESAYAYELTDVALCSELMSARKSLGKITEGYSTPS